MTSRTFSRVDSRTFTPPLSTRETVPTPTPAAAATSAIVGRSGVRTGTSLNGIAILLETIPIWICLFSLRWKIASRAQPQGASPDATAPAGTARTAPGAAGHPSSNASGRQRNGRQAAHPQPAHPAQPRVMDTRCPFSPSRPAPPPAGNPGRRRCRTAQTAGADQAGVFTSDLSVSEYVLLGEAGFEPLGFVVGSSIYHVGLQVGRWSQNQELQMVTQAIASSLALYMAWELAMARMQPRPTFTLGLDR